MSNDSYSPGIRLLIEKQLATGRYETEDQVLEAALQRLNNDDSDD